MFSGPTDSNTGGSLTSVTTTTTRMVSTAKSRLSLMVTNKSKVAGSSQRNERASKSNSESSATVMTPLAGLMANAPPLRSFEIS